MPRTDEASAVPGMFITENPARDLRARLMSGSAPASTDSSASNPVRRPPTRLIGRRKRLADRPDVDLMEVEPVRPSDLQRLDPENGRSDPPEDLVGDVARLGLLDAADLQV